MYSNLILISSVKRDNIFDSHLITCIIMKMHKM